MDKKVIFAVAGSGKTTYIVNGLSLEKRSLIVTYTIANYENLNRKILRKFRGVWPANITLMTYFSFLFRFCYKPFLADVVGAKGVFFEPNTNRYQKKTDNLYYMTTGGYFYSNRLSQYLMERMKVIDDIRERITDYFDEFIIDEVQDFAGRDFSFLEKLMETNVYQLFVGDFYQHTYDTSRDGNVNSNLFDDRIKYEERYVKKGVKCDHTTLINSWRCSKPLCNYITENLGISIDSNRNIEDITKVEFVSDSCEIERIMRDESIVKLHYQKSSGYGSGHKNWGETKGEDHYYDVCILLNKTTFQKYKTGKLNELVPSTRNKLYVALSRARGNVYLINEEVTK